MVGVAAGHESNSGCDSDSPLGPAVIFICVRYRSAPTAWARNVIVLPVEPSADRSTVLTVTPSMSSTICGVSITVAAGRASCS